MKKIVIIFVSIFFFTANAQGDDVDNNLPGASEQIKARTRDMINVGIPSQEAIDMTRMMVENRFRQEVTIRAQNIVLKAKKNELPVGPIMNKVPEGVAKRVPDDFVLQAMETTLSRYAFAYEKAKSIAKDQGQVEKIATAIANSLSAGMKARDIDTIMVSTKERSVQLNQNLAEALALETFLATRTMARMGVSSNAATEVVCQAHQNGFNVREMKQVRSSFTDHATRANSGEMANQYSREIGRGEKAGNLGKTEGGTGREPSSEESDHGSGGSGPGGESGSGGGSEGSGGGSETGGDSGGSGGEGSGAGSEGSGSGGESGSGGASEGSGGGPDTGSDSGGAGGEGSGAGSGGGGSGGESGSGGAGDGAGSSDSGSGSDSGGSSGGGGKK